jgi:hypothetical protein
MNVKLFLAVAAVVSILYGIAFVLVPALLLATYGMTTDASTVLSARYFGLTLLGLGLIAWFVKDTSDRRALRGLLVSLAISAAVGVLVSIWGSISGIMNVMGWSGVLVYVVWLAFCVYYLFADRSITDRV